MATDNPDVECSIFGCDRPERTRGWCYKHYMRWLRNGDPMVVQKRHRIDPDAKYEKCMKCGQIKPTETGFYSDKSRNSGRHPYCKSCVNTYRKAKYAKKGPEENARRNAARYGLEYETYLEMLAEGCGLCGKTEGLCIDHDHETGRVRKALCQSCNRGIGLLRDDPARLRAAADYIERHRVEVASGARVA